MEYLLDESDVLLDEVPMVLLVGDLILGDVPPELLNRVDKIADLLLMLDVDFGLFLVQLLLVDIQLLELLLEEVKVENALDYGEDLGLEILDSSVDSPESFLLIFDEFRESQLLLLELDDCLL